MINHRQLSKTYEALDFHSLFRIFSLFFLICFCVTYPGVAQSAGQVGKITAFEGTVDILRGGALPALPVKVGDDVFIKDIIRTKSAAKATITFVDGNILNISQRSRIDISEYVTDDPQGKRVINMPRGKVEAKVNKLAKELTPGSYSFEIHTPNAVAGVRGTEYIVYNDGTVSGIFVKTGTVYVINPANPGVVIAVSAGYFTTVSGLDVPANPTEATPEEKLRFEGAATGTTGDATFDTTGGTTGGIRAYFVETPNPPAPPPPPPPPPITELINPDSVPPIVSTVLEPPLLTNSKTGSFEFQSNEMVYYSYSLDGSPAVSIPAPMTTLNLVFDPLSDGNHTLVVTATDLFGNSTSTTTTWTTDTTAPVLSGLSGPGLTNAHTATIGYTGSDANPITYTYTLDGVPVGSPNLTGLSEGSHTFVVTATDGAGNSSSSTYNWITDYTAPVITAVSSAAAPEAGTALTTINVSATGTDAHAISYSYRVDGGTWSPSSGSSLSISGISEGTHTIDILAQDAAGNVSSVSSLSFDLSRSVLTGAMTGTGSVITGSTTGDVAAILGQSWGGWQIDTSGTYTGSHGSSWQTAAGGAGYDSADNPLGYWLDKASGTFSGSTMSGTSSLTFLTTTTLGTGTGTVSGSYTGTTSGSWNTTETGSNFTETPLVLSGWMEGGFFLPTGGGWYMDSNSYVPGLIGSINTGNPYSNLLALGQVVNPSSPIWGGNIQGFIPVVAGSSSLAGATGFAGFIGGIVGLDNSLKALSVSLYVTPDGHTGFLYTDWDSVAQTTHMNGMAYPNIGIWEMSGDFTQITRGGIGSTSITPEQLLNAWSTRDPNYMHTETDYHDFNGAIYGSMDSESVTLLNAYQGTDLPWGIWNLIGGGWYESGSPVLSGPWDSVSGKTGYQYDGSYDVATTYGLVHIHGNQWSGGNFVADVTGREIEIMPDGSFASMSSTSGALVGVYDSSNWQAIGGGTSTKIPLAFGSGVGIIDNRGFMYVAPADTPSGIDVYSDSTLTGMTGLMGGTANLWSGGSVPFFMMGQYDNPNNRTLWFMDAFIGYDTRVSNPTYDPCTYNVGCQRPVSAGWSISGSGLYGGMAGIALNNVIEGFGAAIYIKSDGTTGYILTNDIHGKLYPDLSMWEADGSWTVHPMGTSTLSPSQLYDGTAFTNDSTNFWLVGGDISGGMNVDPLSLADQNDTWGIWKSGLAGAYTGTPSANWTAHAGGTEYELCGSECQYLWGIQIAHITGDAWSGNRLSGTVNGRILNLEDLATFSGPLLGTYDLPDVGTWQAVSAGAWSSTPLTFVSTIDSQLTSTTREYFKQYNYSDGTYSYYYTADSTSGYLRYFRTATANADYYIYYYRDGAYWGWNNGTSISIYGNWKTEGYATIKDAIEAMTVPDSSNVTATYSDNYPVQNNVGNMYSLMGSTDSLWTATAATPASVVMMGEYYPDTTTPHMWNSDSEGYRYIYSYDYIQNSNTTYIGGAYLGFLDGIDTPTPNPAVRHFEGLFYGLYIDPNGHAGILKGNLAGSGYSDINLFEMDGTMFPVEMVTASAYGYIDSELYGAYTEDLVYTDSYTFSGPFSSGGSLSGTLGYTYMTSIDGEDWGVSRTTMFGEYSGSTSNNWGFETNLVLQACEGCPYELYGTKTTGAEWANSIVKGDYVGYYGRNGSTGIMFGETLGTFNPNDLTWQAVQMGGWMDTKKFLNMACSGGGACNTSGTGLTANQQRLKDLNIPVVEIGRANLTGTGNFFTNLTMTDVIFFAPTSGAKPMLWATGNVSGAYTAAPVISSPIAVSGSGLTANVAFKDWNSTSGNWLATVNGTGGFNGSTSFQGAAAGTGATSGAGSITGTAAGVAK